MKFLSFEYLDKSKNLIVNVVNINKLEVKKHDNPQNVNLNLYYYEEKGNIPSMFEVEGFDFDEFKNFMSDHPALDEMSEFFTIKVVKDYSWK